MPLKYDFTFAEAAIRYIESGDGGLLRELAALDAVGHIFSHAQRFNPEMCAGSRLDFVTELLPLSDENKLKAPLVRRNMGYARRHIADTDFVRDIVLQYLPEGIPLRATLFFTFGYDIGVAFGENCSLNLAHSIFMDNMGEIKYYAIHELHHAGFIMAKGGYMPSLQIATRGEMAQAIAYFTHLEGMGTYAPLDIRRREDAMDTDKDYIALQDAAGLAVLEQEYFDIYHHFASDPSAVLTREDWGKIGILSDGKRLWYIVGAHMARTIDQRLGRDALVGLMAKPPGAFIQTYILNKG
ncbi:MAG: hypothetical protein FWB88_08505 [Defluviitaleaceae bacterium]|nr:hypothetical protein [Defluviitaleaceae bacterium]MCL2240718.1 hypothetical protein [Defluviitaleaceae bacterium]